MKYACCIAGDKDGKYFNGLVLCLKLNMIPPNSKSKQALVFPDRTVAAHSLYDRSGCEFSASVAP